MIAVVQRVKQASITVKGNNIANINKGLVVLLGVMIQDSSEDGSFLANKIINFRIFNDENNKMNLTVNDIEGEILVISQFTLCADWLKGRRPSFIRAASPEIGKKLYEHFIADLRNGGVKVNTGQFGAMMDVSLVNDGPVTFVLDSSQRR
jgi:D-tyrosyl-tRNA(Tyr) deacylase